MNITQPKYMSSPNAKSPFYEYSGEKGKIAGQVVKLSAPFGFPCLVTLHERSSKQLVGTAITDDSGYYTFNFVNPCFYYTIVASDPARQYNAVIQDMVRPK